MPSQNMQSLRKRCCEATKMVRCLCIGKYTSTPFHLTGYSVLHYFTQIGSVEGVLRSINKDSDSLNDTIIETNHRFNLRHKQRQVHSGRYRYRVQWLNSQLTTDDKQREIHNKACTDNNPLQNFTLVICCGLFATSVDAFCGMTGLLMTVWLLVIILFMRLMYRKDQLDNYRQRSNM